MQVVRAEVEKVADAAVKDSFPEAPAVFKLLGKGMDGAAKRLSSAVSSARSVTPRDQGWEIFTRKSTTQLFREKLAAFQRKAVLNWHFSLITEKCKFYREKHNFSRATPASGAAGRWA